LASLEIRTMVMQVSRMPGKNARATVRVSRLAPLAPRHEEMGG
jgi:hypothetical protein